MEKIKLLSGKTYQLVTNGIRNTDDGYKFIFDPGEDGFDSVEKEFCNSENTKIMYIVGNNDETSQSIVGYTKYKGMEKSVEYQISSQETGTVMIVTMSKPEIEDRVKTIEQDASIYKTVAILSAFKFTDQQAVKVKELYPKWSSLPDGEPLTKQEDAVKGTEITKVLGDDGKLYKVITSHNKQSDWAPGQATASLFTVIDEEHSGTVDDPIPYSVNMVVYNGKYYSYNGVVYLCIRDSGIALQYTPDQLLNNYFSVVTN